MKLKTVFIWKSVRLINLEKLGQIDTRIVRVPPPVAFVCEVSCAQKEGNSLKSGYGVELFLASRFSQSSSWNALAHASRFVIRQKLVLNLKAPKRKTSMQTFLQLFIQITEQFFMTWAKLDINEPVVKLIHVSALTFTTEHLK